MTKLGEFLRDGAARPREPGVWDCCGLPAAWAMACGHPDPMAAWRGVYDTDEAGEAYAKKYGLVALMGEGLIAAGLTVREGEPQPGDIAVLSFLGQEAGGIFTGDKWALVGDRGLVFSRFTPAHILQVWEPRPWEKR